MLGEATIEVQTDDPDIRFQIGNKLTLDDGRQLTIRSSRWNNQILLLAFEAIVDRNQIEELRDQLISSEVDLGSLAPGEYHFQQLIGCEVFQQNGELIGAVDEIVDPTKTRTAIAAALKAAANPDGSFPRGNHGNIPL